MKATLKRQTSRSLIRLSVDEGLALFEPQICRFGLRFGRSHHTHINLRSSTMTQRRYLLIEPILGGKCTHRADKLDAIEEAERSWQQR